MKSFAQVGIVLVATAVCASLGISACSKDSPTATATAVSPPLAGALPIRRFFQVPKMVPNGHEVLIDVSARPDNKRVLIEYVQANSSTRRLGARIDDKFKAFDAEGTHHLGAYFDADMAHVIVCSAEVTATFKGHGPSGDVFTYSEGAPQRLVCWASADAITWRRTVIEEVAAGAAALWPIVLRATEGGAFDLAYVRDSEFDFEDRTAVGRASTDKTISRVLHVGADLSITMASRIEEPFVDMSAAMMRALTDVSCEGRCGKLWNGVDFEVCGDCAAGESCTGNICTKDSCTKISREEACAPRSQLAACGEHSDGCGATYDCGGCGAGETCGASRVPAHCGVRIGRMSPSTLRARYHDEKAKLCGLFTDSRVGDKVDLGPCATAGEKCVNNVCAAAR